MKKLLAWLIDFILAFPVWAWVLSRIQGAEMTFSLYNEWLLIFLVGVVVYFVAAKKYWGETPGEKIINLM